MYIGHFSVALMGKGARPRVPLWVLVGAVFVVDLLGAGLHVAGFTAPFIRGAKSAVVVAAWAIILGGTYGALRRDGWGGLLVAGCVLTHPLLDALTNDVLLWPDGPRFGGQLYTYPAWDFAAEAALVTAGWLLYRRTLPPQTRNAWTAWGLLVALLALQAVFDLWTAEVWSFFW